MGVKNGTLVVLGPHTVHIREIVAQNMAVDGVQPYCIGPETYLFGCSMVWHGCQDGHLMVNGTMWQKKKPQIRLILACACSGQKPRAGDASKLVNVDCVVQQAVYAHAGATSRRGGREGQLMLWSCL